VTRAGAWAAVAALPLIVSACAETQVTVLGDKRPRKPEDCVIEMYPTTTVPPYPFTPIAKVRTGCDPVRRNTCVEQLRAEACRAGADAVVGFKEEMVELTTYIDATFVVKGPAPRDVAAGACDPICSPGFACQSGQCVPQCNPACQTGEICSRKRVCEPNVGPSPVATPPAPPAPPASPASQ